MDSIANLLRTKCIYSTPYSSRSNSKCKRNNKKALACFRLLHQTIPGGLQENYLPLYCAGISSCLNSLPLKTLNGISPKICMTNNHYSSDNFMPITSHIIPRSVATKYQLYQHFSILYETLYAIYTKQRDQFHENKQKQKYNHNYKI